MVNDGGVRRRNSRRWLLVSAGIAVTGAALAVAGIWYLPDRMYTGPGETEARAVLQSGLLTAAAALTAVAGGLIALGETRHANSNTHVRELYTRAVDQLGADNNTIRLGGIYALERIATDSPADQRTVVEVLSAFVRDRSTDPALRPPAPRGRPGRVRVPTTSTRPATDVHAAVTVLARLPVRKNIPRADLDGADLTGPAGLRRLRAPRGSLAEATLARADLSYAELRGANLSHAVLDGVILARGQLAGANLAGAWLDGANLAGAQLRKANFTRAKLGAANLTNAQLVRANFTHAGLGGADLRGAALGGADLNDAWLGAADLTQTGLEGADLGRARGLTQAQVNAARGDSRTRLPATLRRPTSWLSPPPEN